MKLTIFCSSIYVSLLAGIWPLSMAQAQVIPDNTLGSENSVVTPNVVINGINSDRLEGGAIRGSNLFHSFQEFSVREGRGAYFSNPEGIANIFSRVTGGNISQIMGILGVLGNANLYFLNPNGILFGPNAQLDVRGSFLATTADSFQFPNPYGFSASNPTAPPLLTVNIPIGLNFRENTTATISNQGTLKTGQDLVLAGNNLNLQGHLEAGNNLTLMATDTVTIRDSLTTPFIAAAWGDLTIQGDKTVDIFALNHPDSGLFSLGNMTLRSAEQVGGDAHFWSGGNFRIERLDGSLGKLYSPHDPVIRTAGDVLIGSYIGASLHIIAGGKVEIPGYVWIVVADPNYGLKETITLADGTVVNIDGQNQPTLDIRAGVSPEFIGEPFLQGSGFDIFGNPINLTDIPSSADINIGTIIFRDFDFLPITGYVSLTNQYQPNPLLSGNIQVSETLPGFRAITTGGALTGGDITLSSRNNIDILGNVRTSSEASAGNILMNAVGDLTIVGNVLAQSNDLAGNITINSGGTASLLNGSQLNVSSGEGGNIIIHTKDLVMSGGSLILAGIASNLGSPEAQAGNIMIDATGLIWINGAIILNEVGANGMGRSGNIKVLGQSVLIENGGGLIVRGSGEGNTGEVSVNATDTITVKGISPLGFTSSIVNVAETGNSGGITIEAGSLLLEEGGYINTGSYGQGASGLITIKARDSVTITGESSDDKAPSFIASQVFGVGNSRGITVETSFLLLEKGAFIDASTLGEGDAGMITINATDNVTITGESSQGSLSILSSVVGSTGGGNSGGIILETDSLLLEKGGSISARTLGQGDAGTITIKARDNIIISGESSQGNASYVSSQVSSTAVGNSGGMNLETDSLLLEKGGYVTASSIGKGNAGAITVKARESIKITGESSQGESHIASQVQNAGNSEGISLETASLLLEDGGYISTDSYGEGNSGSVTIKATETIIVTGESLNSWSSITSQVQGKGNSGGITMETASLLLDKGAFIDASTLGEGNAGDIVIKARDNVTVLGNSLIASQVSSEGKGNSGDIVLDTSSLLLNEGNINASTYGRGSAGDIFLNAQKSINLNEASIFANVNDGAVGNAGDLVMTTNLLRLENGGIISTATFGNGMAGNITITANQSLDIIGNENSSGILSQTLNSNRAGNITINTGTLMMQNRSIIDSETYSSGTAGNININAFNAIAVSGTGEMTTAITSRTQGSGSGGNLTLTTGSLSLEKGAQIAAGTFGEGNSGSLFVVADSIHLKDMATGLFTQTEGQGNSNNLTIQARNLLVENGAVISASTTSSGQGGNLIVNSSESVELRGINSSLQAKTEGSGNAGNVTVTTPQFIVNDGAKASVETTSLGSPGDITITSDQLIIGTNAQLSATITPTSTNTTGGGSITLNASNLDISGQLGIFAETQGQAPAGSLTLNPDNNNPDLNIRFTNDGFISARTSSSGKGGNINLSAPNLIDIRGQGKITT